MPDTKYCAVGVYDGQGDKPVLMSTGGKVIVFDTKSIAQETLPILANGRDWAWDATGEHLWFFPLDEDKVNHLCIFTDYDVYNLPAGLPVVSESRGLDWKRHIIWTLWLMDKGQFEKQDDGTVVNLATV